MMIIKDIYDDDHHQAMLLLSPVDGVDPFGLVPTFCISPPQPLHFRSSSSKSFSRFRSSSSSLQLHHRRTPTLIIAGGLDSVPGIDVGGLMPACAPQVRMMMLHRWGWWWWWWCSTNEDDDEKTWFLWSIMNLSKDLGSSRFYEALEGIIVLSKMIATHW